MSTKEPEIDWREGRRRHTEELKHQGRKQQDIAAALGVTPGTVSQWLERAREAGEAALRRRRKGRRAPLRHIERGDNLLYELSS